MQSAAGLLPRWRRRRGRGRSRPCMTLAAALIPHPTTHVDEGRAVFAFPQRELQYSEIPLDSHGAVRLDGPQTIQFPPSRPGDEFDNAACRVRQPCGVLREEAPAW